MSVSRSVDIIALAMLIYFVFKFVIVHFISFRTLHTMHSSYHSVYAIIIIIFILIDFVIQVFY